MRCSLFNLLWKSYKIIRCALIVNSLGEESITEIKCKLVKHSISICLWLIYLLIIIIHIDMRMAQSLSLFCLLVLYNVGSLMLNQLLQDQQ